VEIDSEAELGRRLRSRRTAAGRTIASVAMEAGLSVPYIANLENGRGNPTVATLTNWAQALGAELRVELVDPDGDRPDASIQLPESLLQFARLPRFAQEAKRVAEISRQPVAATRERMLTAMASIGAVSAGNLEELDWHRLLDVIVLINRPAGRR
jgi:transcriptional regulator with XRE-family HTH domain